MMRGEGVVARKGGQLEHNKVNEQVKRVGRRAQWVLIALSLWRWGVCVFGARLEAHLTFKELPHEQIKRGVFYKNYY